MPSGEFTNLDRGAHFLDRSEASRGAASALGLAA
jgi:hypothetical protein